MHTQSLSANWAQRDLDRREANGRRMLRSYAAEGARNLEPTIRTMPRAADVDREAVRELDLYAENTAELYPQFLAIVANLSRKIECGTYRPELAPKLWRYWYEEAARLYVREFGQPGDLRSVFPPSVRQACAEERAVDEEQKITRGEYR